MNYLKLIRHTICVLQRTSRPPVLFDYNEGNHVVLVNNEHHAIKDVDICKKIIYCSWDQSNSANSAAQRCKPWMHGTIVLYGSDYHNGIIYKIRVTKMGYIITATKRHLKATTVPAEDYL